MADDFSIARTPGTRADGNPARPSPSVGGTAMSRELVFAGQARVAVAHVDPSGRVVHANREFLTMLGGGQAGVVGRTLWQLTLPDTFHLFERVKATRQPSEMETGFQRDDGSNIWVSLSLTPVIHPDGSLLSITAVAIDIDEHRRTREALAADLADTRLLHELGARLVSEENIEAVYQEILAAAVALTRAAAGAVQILDAENGDLALLASHGFGPEMVERFGRVSASSPTSCGLALSSRERTFIDFDDPDHDDATGTLDLMVGAGFLTAQSTPLIARSGHLIGMLTTHWRTRRRPGERDLRFLDLLARQAADLIEHRQGEVLQSENEAKLATELADAMELHKISSRLTGEDHDGALCEEILAAAVALMRSEMGTFQVFRPRRNSLEMVASVGLHEESTEFWQWVNEDSATACAMALAKSERTIIPDVEVWSPMTGTSDLHHCRLSRIRSVQSTPLVSRSGNLVGMISTLWSRVHHPSERELRLFDILARQAADLIERGETLKKLRLAAETDAFRLALTDDLRPLDDPSEIIATAVRALGNHLAATRTAYIEIEADGDHGIVRHDHCRGVASTVGRHRLDDFGPTFVKRLRTGLDLIVADSASDPLLSDADRRVWAEFQTRATIAVPIIKHGRLAAILKVAWSTPHDAPLQQIALVGEIAGRTWNAAERARAERALRKSEERLAAIFATAEVGLSEISLDGEIRRVNDTLCRLLGRKPGELVGKFLGTVTHPDDLPASLAAVQRLIDTREPVTLEKRYVRADGEIVWASSTLSLLAAPPDEPPGFLAVTVDLTARKRAEAALLDSEVRLRTAMESAGMGAWDWDVARDRIRWNTRHFLLLGLPPKEQEIDAAGFLNHVHPDDRRRVGSLLLEAIDEAGVFRAEFRIIRADNGEVRWMSGFGNTIASREGRATRMTGAMYDSTGRRAHAESLQRARELLEKRVAERTRELGDALDHLRAESLEREKAEQARRDLLQRLVHTQEEERARISRELHDNLGQHMVAVLLHLDTFQKQFSRAGESSPDGAAGYEFADLRRVIDELIKAVHRQSWELRPVELDQLGLEVAMEHYVAHWTAATGIPAKFEAIGDGFDVSEPEIAIALYRVVQEALTNVARHAEANMVTVALDNHSGLKVSIQDDGRGFHPDAVGRRLGLLGMIERMTIIGGTLDIDSAPGRGTTITARIGSAGGRMSALHITP